MDWRVARRYCRCAGKPKDQHERFQVVVAKKGMRRKLFTRSVSVDYVGTGQKSVCKHSLESEVDVACEMRNFVRKENWWKQMYGQVGK